MASLVYSQLHSQLMDLLPSNKGRSSMVHSLLKSLGVLQKLLVLDPIPATTNDLTRFHSEDYIEFLCNLQRSSDESINSFLLEFNLLDDNPLFDGLDDYVKNVVGGSLTAARSLIQRESKVAIHWDGGRHHGQKDEASGFCYVNDIVICILELCQHFPRVLYIDLDLHHGDGVEKAFYNSSKVFTVSIHRHDFGFFPGFYSTLWTWNDSVKLALGSGDSKSVGEGNGEWHSLNLPLKEGLSNSNLISLFQNVVMKVLEIYQPNVVVMQCGTDGLVDDPYKEWNLTVDSFAHCVYNLLKTEIPMLLLGGGYNHPNTAKCWTMLTSLCMWYHEQYSIPHSFESWLAKASSEQIPEDDPFFLQYGPDFTLSMVPGNRADKNNEILSSDDYILFIKALEKIYKPSSAVCN